MIKVLIADHHPVVIKGLQKIFESSHDIQIAEVVKSGRELFDIVGRRDFDVIISEIDLPELNGITALRAIKKENKKIKVIMFSHQPEEIYAISTIKAGASGYLNKTADLDLLQKAVETVLDDKIYLSEKMDKHYRYEDTRKSRTRLFKKLSTREVEVLKLLSIGKKNKEIAQELDINEKTVSTYKARLFKKLNVTNVVDLIHQAEHHNLT